MQHSFAAKINFANNHIIRFKCIVCNGTAEVFLSTFEGNNILLEIEGKTLCAYICMCAYLQTTPLTLFTRMHYTLQK